MNENDTHSVILVYKGFLLLQTTFSLKERQPEGGKDGDMSVQVTRRATGKVCKCSSNSINKK